MRHLLTILVILSLAWCGATAVLWIRSHYVRDRLGWESYDHNTWKCRSVLFDTRPGQLGIQIANVTPKSDWLIAQFQQKSLQSNYYRRTDSPASRGWIGNVLWSRLGLWLDGWKTPLPDRSSTGWRVALPYWFIQLVGLTLTSLTMRIKWNWHRRSPHTLPGYCPQCGYDLRASKDRCPECGHPIG